MNAAIERIKRGILKQLPPKKEKYNGADVDGDEKRTRDFLAKYGKDWTVTSDRNKYERWDIEGTQSDDAKTRVEVKTRPKNNDYPTWIIDSYKVDWLLENHKEGMNYFVNVCDGKYHLYDMRYIAACPTRTTYAKMWNGGNERKTFYQFKKDMFCVELTTGEFGEGAEFNEYFNKLKDEK